jgi:hypothetical protein
VSGLGPCERTPPPGALALAAGSAIEWCEYGKGAAACSIRENGMQAVFLSRLQGAQTAIGRRKRQPWDRNVPLD